MADDRKTVFWMLSDQVHLSPKGKECTLDKKFCSPTFSVHLTHKPVVPRCVSFHRLCCQNLWEATRKSQPIVAMWNPRAGATPSCIWWRAFLGILESSQLLTVLLNLPTVDNFHFCCYTRKTSSSATVAIDPTDPCAVTVACCGPSWRNWNHHPHRLPSNFPNEVHRGYVSLQGV